MGKLKHLVVPAASLMLAVMLSVLAGPSRIASARLAMMATGGCQTFMEIPQIETWLPRGNKNGIERKKGNSILVRLKWEPVGGHDDVPKKFSFSLHNPPALKGICINKGKESLADYTLEAGDNPEWLIEEGIKEYEGDQNLAAVTRKAYPSGEWVDIVVRSYDFGAWTRVEGTAIGCPPVERRIPKDKDEDTLPDRWELGKQFFGDAAERISYSIGAKRTYNNELDSESDRDGSWAVGGYEGGPLSLKIHDEPGDGFTAFEEYRGVFVQGEFYRMNQLENDGGLELPAGDRGPKLKDLFVYDPDDFIEDSSVMLRELGIAVHRIRKDEMSAETDAQGPVAGYVNFNSPGKKQRAVWFERGGLGGLFGFSNGFSVNGDPKPIWISRNRIMEYSKEIRLFGAAPPNPGVMEDLTVAHELGHKLGLRHPATDVTESLIPPPQYSETAYWHTDRFLAKVFRWALVERIEKTTLPGVEKWRPLSSLVDYPNPILGGNKTHNSPEEVVPLHGMNHVAVVWNSDFVNDFRGTQRLRRHLGVLMDSTMELAKLTPPMDPEKRKKIKVHADASAPAEADEE